MKIYFTIQDWKTGALDPHNGRFQRFTIEVKLQFYVVVRYTLQKRKCIIFLEPKNEVHNWHYNDISFLNNILNFVQLLSIMPYDPVGIQRPTFLVQSPDRCVQVGPLCCQSHAPNSFLLNFYFKIAFALN